MTSQDLFSSGLKLQEGVSGLRRSVDLWQDDLLLADFEALALEGCGVDLTERGDGGRHQNPGEVHDAEARGVEERGQCDQESELQSYRRWTLKRDPGSHEVMDSSVVAGS